MKMVTNQDVAEAEDIQVKIDEQFELDICHFKNAQLVILRDLLNKYLATGLDTSYLTVVAEHE